MTCLTCHFYTCHFLYCMTCRMPCVSAGDTARYAGIPYRARPLMRARVRYVRRAASCAIVSHDLPYAYCIHSIVSHGLTSACHATREPFIQQIAFRRNGEDRPSPWMVKVYLVRFRDWHLPTSRLCQSILAEKVDTEIFLYHFFKGPSNLAPVASGSNWAQFPIWVV